MIQTVTVGLGERAYEVRIGPGLIAEAGRHIRPLLKRGRTAVISDETVWRLHGPDLTAALAAEGISASPVLVPAGEGSKSFEMLARVSDDLLALELDRGDLIVAFGGGVVGDLAGFAAAIYKRGIDFVQIPTTLLAQVDSSVGGKTAIDTPRGKNLIGAFHQPRLVLADLDVLASLPPRELRAGYAEILKYGLLGDLTFFQWLEIHGQAVIDLEPDALTHAVRRSVEMKAQIVAEDEREAGRRALLNLGHTFGHALESESGYGDALLHGEAVAIGMAMAFRYSAAQGLCPGQDAGRAQAAIAAVGLPVRLNELASHPFDGARLLGHMAQDKKAEGGRLTFILARALGEAIVARDVEADAILQFLTTEGARSAGAQA
ncbi:MAG: 3-dehydroquinate synthase [Phenylobacterium sp.]|uniref:3-dehydroquinate synthase n=1 Tax=Phenylobacterium sp. TaxID=1871053 RepID=UPI0025E0CE3C|nr:3-dehydroquinate synthase [Phenylobacterium sp.]MCG9917379.1 3-dehydroquinate synthase [Phenylobacterium sp.]